MATFQGNLPDFTTAADVPAGGRNAAVYIETYGCQMNVYDSQAIDGLLRRAGYTLVEHDLQADVILLNTCSVRELAEHKIISRVGELRHRRTRADLPEPIIGICGCMAERLGPELRKGPRKVDLVVGVDNYDTLPGLLGDLTGDRGDAAPAGLSRTVTGHRSDAHYVAPPSLYPTNNSHLVTIHKGCDYKCTYCIVPATRGPQSEKSPDAILAEITDIVAGGGTEVTLLGQNVTAYNWQGGLDFAALLEKVVEISGLERIRFLTGHPRDMHRHTMDAIGRLDKVCPWLHVPVQAGADRVLRRMKRLYTADEYLAMVAYARNVIPDVTFSTDFIVGFPGETAAEFEATLEMARKVRYDQAFCFKYSVRPGVPAAKLDDDVGAEEKKRRLAALLAVQEEVWRGIADGCVGSAWDAVVEGPARHQEAAGDGPSWRLRTGNNRKVILHGGAYEVGQTVPVRITGWKNTTFLGEARD
ncbi:tRNA (N6-isopentenyl adenosine(37)-C2)-methylthiotransferase MiaB [bacterium]|nr:tRNA (N6-isopentenyl adenosine(37)-C2)-methylthiotransferase MiaB [bacterium]